MNDEFTPYENGMTHILRQLSKNPPKYQDALGLQLRLERTIAEIRYYGPEPTLKNELNRILRLLNDLSLQNTEKSFNEWREMPALAELSVVSEEMQQIERYTGNLESLHAGVVYQELTNRLTAMGARSISSRNIMQEDILERYLAIPLHAMFLYTRQDQAIAPYILDHWDSLDALSGNVCDIHPSIDQFNNLENAYNYIERLDVIREAVFRAYSKLPCLFFWDHGGATEYISFGSKADSSDITYILRIIFEALHCAPVIDSVTHAKKLLD